MFYIVGLIIELHLAYVLIQSWTAFGTLSPEMQAGTIWNLFLQFWSGITQFVIGWLVAHSKRETLPKPREKSVSEKVALPKPVFTIIKIALIIVAIFVAILLVFGFIQYVHVNPIPVYACTLNLY
jgi:hypothetical protein